MSDELTDLQGYRAELAQPSAQAREQARERLAAAIAAERTTPPAPARRAGSARGWRLRTAIAATTALAAAVAIVAATQHSSSPPTSTMPAPITPAPHTAPAAWIVFDRLATVAAAQPVAPPPKGSRYRLTTSESVNLDVLGGSIYDKCTRLVPKYRQRWVNARGAGSWREREGKAAYLSPGEADACEKKLKLESEKALVINEVRFAPHCTSSDPVSLRGLPTDPARLRARLLDGSIEGGPHTAADAFSRAGDLLRNTDASPRLRAALYRAAAGLHGVQSLGVVSDHAGRRGVGLAAVNSRLRMWQELIFDPKTSALMGEESRTAATRRGFPVPAGTVTEWSVFYPSRIVNSQPPARAGARIDNCHERQPGLSRQAASAQPHARGPEPSHAGR